jgi:transcriptional regulator with XRE-family HTH domain
MARDRKPAARKPAERKPSAPSPLRFFGAEVRRARTQADLSLNDLAARVPCDPSTVSRVENGILAPDSHFAAVCDEAFPQADGFFGRFYAESRDWNAPYIVPFRPFAQDEANATALYVWEPVLIPGLLQTEDYARAILTCDPKASDGEVAERLTGRMTRQKILFHNGSPDSWFVIDSAVLGREVGGPKVMQAALRHLAEMARRPNVTLQVLTAPMHLGLQGSLNIAETTGAETIAWLDDIAGGRLIEDPATVAAVAARFRHFQTEALTPADSLDLIEQTAEERWSTL